MLMRVIVLGIPTTLISLAAAGNPNPATTGQKATIENRHIKVVVEQGDEGSRESFYAKQGTAWRLMLQSGSSLRPDFSWRGDGKPGYARMWEVVVGGDTEKERIITLAGETEIGAMTKTLRLVQDKSSVHVQIEYAIKKRVTLSYLLSTYSSVFEGTGHSSAPRLDFVYTPQLRPQPEHLIADHTFRSPALMMQQGSRFAALVPVVSSIDQKNRVMASVGDLQVETAEHPFFSFGLQNWQPEPYRQRNTHVYYASSDTLAATLSDTTLSYEFLLFLDAVAPPRLGYQQVVRYHWKANGERYFAKSTGPQSEPFSSYIQKAWFEFLPQIALDAEYRGQPVTLLRQGRLAWSNNLPKSADNDCWFNVWFNSLRTAYGIHLYGRQIGDKELMRTSENVLNLSLLAPQKDGIAPSIFYLDSTGGHWVADQAWGGISKGEYYAMFRNAWTNYWMLQWMDLLPKRKNEILQYTCSFADFLIRHQLPSGVIPSWYHPETLDPAPALRDENAETAGAALFLSEFSRRTGERKYRAAAERRMKYIFTHILPQQKWFDYETFFSCSRKPLDFYDSYTQQFPQNTLSMHQAAEACLSLYGLTGKRVYKEKGIQILDYLCLYQQVWNPQWLSAELFGGFGVQNTDAEWSDSRQGYFAVTLMNYYELTGKKEYFERGVAALRAMFSLFESPTSCRTAENYGHSGRDQLAGVTGIHWGTGSSVVSIHLIRQRYGDAYVNVKEQWGVGIDGCGFKNVLVKDETIRFDLVDYVATPRTASVKFSKIPRKSYRIIANGRDLGVWSKNALEKGIDVAL